MMDILTILIKIKFMSNKKKSYVQSIMKRIICKVVFFLYSFTCFIYYRKSILQITQPS